MTTYFFDPYLTTGNNDGSSWENAYQSFEYAVGHFAGADNELWCKSGDVIDGMSFQIDSNSKIYGGFSRDLTGTAGSIYHRDFTKNRTTLKKSYTSTPMGCLRIQNVSNVEINGINFQYCEAVSGVGSAIYITGSSNVSIRYCDFLNCSDGSVSGGAATAVIDADGNVATNTDLSIYKCRFENCGSYSGSYGRPLYLRKTSHSISYCLFKNCGGSTSGAIDSYQCTGAISNCWFSECRANSYCDFIRVREPDTKYSISKCVFEKSIAGSSLYAVMIRCGSGSDARTVIENCLFANTLVGGLATYGNEYDTFRVVNCTFHGNPANPCIYMPSGSGSSRTSYVANSILYPHTIDAYTIYHPSATVNVTYSDIDGGYSGTGNVDVDPQWLGSPDREPDRLNAVTACVNGGRTSVTGYSSVDLSGYTRDGSGGYCDMGCYEFTGARLAGAIDADDFKLVLNPGFSDSDQPMKMCAPYLIEENPWAVPVRGSLPCYPVRFGSVIKKDSTDSTLREKFNFLISAASMVYRDNTSQISSPAVGDDFPAIYKVAGKGHIGTTGLDTTGAETICSVPHKPRYDVIEYQAEHTDNATGDDLTAYCIWVEAYPTISPDAEPCARWLSSAVDVCEPDDPISSGIMIELVRLLKKLVWEMRGPMPIPVFGCRILRIPDPEVVVV